MPNPASDRPLSKVVPHLVAALICDAAAQDQLGKKTLVGIFDQLRALKFPTTQQMTLYMKLADAEGRYEIEIRFVRVRDGKGLATMKSNTIDLPDRLASCDFLITPRPLSIEDAGRYEFQIWVNGAYIGAAFLDATSLGDK